MTDRAQTILTVAMAAYTSGWLTGLFAAGLAQRRGRPMRPPRGSYGIPYISVGYQPRSQGGPTNPPPRNP